mgnify:FL=1|tara:strand:+ start:65 stop:814 length:750 start_codon:yes stop_codon:yes gene_type:complete
MKKGVLLFCFDTVDHKYHKILERCVYLLKKNLGLEITVVTNFETFKNLRPLGFINYKFIEPEIGNKKNGQEWKNVDRHMAYELSPYDVTLVMDIDYFCFTDNLKQFLDTGYDFLISKNAHDLSNRNSFDMRRFSMIDMVWATVFVFRKGNKARRIFDMVKYVKSFYSYFMDLYRITDKRFRNDYAFAIALEQANGFISYDTLPIKLHTLPPDCRVIGIQDDGIAWHYNDQINYIKDQDVHVLNKEVAYV